MTPRRNKFAVIGFVCALLAPFLVVSFPFAIVFCVLGKRQIDKSDGAQVGYGFVVATTILVVLEAVVVVALLLWFKFVVGPIEFST